MSNARTLLAICVLAGVGCDSSPAPEHQFRSGQTLHVADATALQAALEELGPGDDIVIVADGSYGELELTGRHFQTEAQIRAATGVRARFDTVRLTDCSGLLVKNIVVRPPTKTAAVIIDGGYDLTLRESDIGFADHAVGWSAADWTARVSTGVRIIEATDVVLNRNYIHHVTRGVDSDGAATDVNRNRINYFADDGVRVFGDDSMVRSNRISNNVKVDANTNVGIQSWSRGPSGTIGGGRVDGLLIWGNAIIESTDPAKAFGAPLQGIGFYDGTYGGLLIAQNLVAVDGWRGIVVFGGDNVNIQYNTVIDGDTTTSRRPDIAIENHKNGTPSVNTRVRNNLASRVGHNPHVAVYGNTIMNAPDYPESFADHENFDFAPTAAVPSNRGSRHHQALGGTLREAAARHGVVAGGGLGSFMCSPTSTNALCDLASTEYDLLVPNNALKWAALRPSQGEFDFSRGDTQVAFAERNDQEVHGHTLLWSAANPPWLEQHRGDGAALAALMDEHIQTVVSHYRTDFPGRVTRWDVVNEAFQSWGALRDDSIWAAVDAGVGPAEYIKRAFRVAHAADPDAHLVLNDFRVESGAKGDAMFALVQQMKSEGVPVHGVGFQSHYDTSWSGVPTEAEILAMMQRYANIGVDVHITELDVRIPSPVDAGELLLSDSFYQRTVHACLAAPNCKTITSWSISAADSGNGGLAGYKMQHAFDANLRPETAYWILRAGQ